jgi:hypothetical protein
VAGPTEAVVKVLGQVPADKRAGITQMSLSALEVPSAIALLRREFPPSRCESTATRHRTW